MDSKSGGMGCLGWLAILFIALKLTGYIDWAWVWVLAPIWGGVIFGLLLIGVMVGFVVWRSR